MNFLLDHCVPLKIKPRLQKWGHNVITLGELGKSSSPDSEVIKLSTSLNRILITCDSDFSNIIEYPLGSHSGILILKFAPPIENAVLLTLQQTLAELNCSKLQGSLLIIDRNKYRLRRVP